MENRTLEKRVDHGALITEMSAALKTASDAWTEVCVSDQSAWKSAFGAYQGALANVESVRAARLQAERESFILFAELAIAVMPVAGIALCPILSARGELLAKTAAKRYAGFAQQAPLMDALVKFAATKAKKPLAEVQQKVKTTILDALVPMDVAAQLAKGRTSAATAESLAQSHVDAVSRIRDSMNVWVQKVARWNTTGEIESFLIPVAHAAFMNHPWIATVPSVADSQQARPRVARAIELSLWLGWLKGRDVKYWYRVEQAVEKYRNAKNEDGRISYRAEFTKLLDDLVDLSPLWPRLSQVDNRFRLESTAILQSSKYSMTSSPRKVSCPNMYRLIRMARGDGVSLQAAALRQTFGMNSDAYDRAAVLLSVSPSAPMKST